MIANANSIVQLAFQIKNGIMKHVHVSVKVIVHARKIIVGILAHVFLKMVSIEKVLLMIQKLCVMNVMDIVSTEMTNTIATNVSTNSDGKKVRYKMDCYILHTVLLVITLSMIITIICYHYAKLKNILPCQQHKNGE